MTGLSHILLSCNKSWKNGDTRAPLRNTEIFYLRINFLIDQNKSSGYPFLSDEKIRFIKYEGISRQMFLYHVVQPGK